MNKLLWNRLLVYAVAGLSVAGAIVYMARSKGFKKMSGAVRDAAKEALDDTLERISKGEVDMAAH